jgi:hypothetical protein
MHFRFLASFILDIAIAFLKSVTHCGVRTLTKPPISLTRQEDNTTFLKSTQTLTINSLKCICVTMPGAFLTMEAVIRAHPPAGGLVLSGLPAIVQ